MDAKEYLSQAFILDRRIKAKERQLDVLKEHVPYTTPLFGDVKVTSSQSTSCVEKSALRIVALSDEIQRDITRLDDIMKAIRQVISRVENNDMECVLQMRYLSFMSWCEITKCLGYSEGHVFRLHRLALKKVNGIIS